MHDVVNVSSLKNIPVVAHPEKITSRRPCGITDNNPICHPFVPLSDLVHEWLVYIHPLVLCRGVRCCDCISCAAQHDFEI